MPVTAVVLWVSAAGRHKSMAALSSILLVGCVVQQYNIDLSPALDL